MTQEIENMIRDCNYYSDQFYQTDDIEDYYLSLEPLSPCQKTILSLFDFSGTWAAPYVEAGYNVIHIDIKHGLDINEINIDFLLDNDIADLYGVLAAPPCTDFSSSGAQYWPAKDEDGRTAASLELVYQVLRIVDFCRPRFWALENPIGRLPRLIPEIEKPWYFQPHFFGDAYTKKSGLWGHFNKDLERNDVEPIRSCKAGSWLMKLGGKSEKTKELRSMTPPGFARAFFNANQ